MPISLFCFLFVFVLFFLFSELVVNNVLGRVHIVANTGGASFCICLLSRYVLVAHRLFLGCSRYVLLFSRRLEKRKLSIRTKQIVLRGDCHNPPGTCSTSEDVEFRGWGRAAAVDGGEKCARPVNENRRSIRHILSILFFF